MKNTLYNAPQIEVIQLVVEQGFAGSLEGGESGGGEEVGGGSNSDW